MKKNHCSRTMFGLSSKQFLKLATSKTASSLSNVLINPHVMGGVGLISGACATYGLIDSSENLSLPAALYYEYEPLCKEWSSTTKKDHISFNNEVRCTNRLLKESLSQSLCPEKTTEVMKDIKKPSHGELRHKQLTLKGIQKFNADRELSLHNKKCLVEKNPKLLEFAKGEDGSIDEKRLVVKKYPNKKIRW